MPARNPDQHKGFVLKDPFYNEMFDSPTATNTFRQSCKLMSQSGMYEALVLDYLVPDHQDLLKINERFEQYLSNYLEKVPVLTDAMKFLNKITGGYDDYNSVLSSLTSNLTSNLKDPLDDKSDKVGTELDLIRQLIAKFGGTGLKAKTDLLLNYVVTEDISFFVYNGTVFKEFAKPAAKDRELLGIFGSDNVQKVLLDKIDLLDPFKDILIGDDTEGTKMLKALFIKVFYTLKFHEMLLGQLGNVSGSLSFKAGIESDFEYWQFLFNLKTRDQKEVRPILGPKPWVNYITEKDASIPWNNQFSMSKGLHEYADVNDIPDIYRLVLEDALEKYQKQGVIDLNSLVALEPVGTPPQKDTSKMEVWTLAAILDVWKTDAKGEFKRKIFYTQILQWYWSKKWYHSVKENPFLELSDKSAALLLEAWEIKDPRVKQFADKKGPLTVQNVLTKMPIRTYGVGRSINTLLTPESAMLEFDRKLWKMSLAQLKDMFSNIPDVKDLTSVDAIIAKVEDDARKKIFAWYDKAYSNCKPIYTGPSGHTLNYTRLYLNHLAKYTPQPSEELYSPEIIRLCMLAGLIGDMEHHSYDEVMISSHGITYNVHGKAGELVYKSRTNYADMLDHPISKAAAEAAIKAVLQDDDLRIRMENSDSIPNWAKTVLVP